MISERAGRVYFTLHEDKDGPRLSIGEDEGGRANLDKMTVARTRHDVVRMIESLAGFLNDFPKEDSDGR